MSWQGERSSATLDGGCVNCGHGGPATREVATEGPAHTIKFKLVDQTDEEIAAGMGTTVPELLKAIDDKIGSMIDPCLDDEQAKYEGDLRKTMFPNGDADIPEHLRNTNFEGEEAANERLKHLTKAEQRAPLPFTMQDVKCVMQAQGWGCDDTEARKVLHFVYAKITSGELRVVKTAHWTKTDRKEPKCSACGWIDDERDQPSRDFDYCPGCGAKIIE